MDKITLLAAAVLATGAALAELDGAALLDRRHCEAIMRPYGLPFDSDQEWERERDGICRRKDGQEYAFYIGLKPKLSAVTEAKSAGEAMDALSELDEYIRKNACGHCADDETDFLKYPGKRRKVSNAMLDYLLAESGNVEVKGVVEGWLAVSGWDVTAALDRTVLECGFTPGVRVTSGLQAKFDKIVENGCLYDDDGNPVYRWKGDSRLFRREVWQFRRDRTEKLFMCLHNISVEVAQITDIFGLMGESEASRKKHAMKAKSTLKSSLAKIDREVKMYSSSQSDKFSRWIDREEYEKWDVRLEALAAHRRLLERIGELASIDDGCKKLVDERLKALKRHIASVEKKRPPNMRKLDGFGDR